MPATTKPPMRRNYRVAAVVLLLAAAAVVGAFVARGPRAVDAKNPANASDANSLAPEVLFSRSSPAVVRVSAYDRAHHSLALGSGFLVSSDGLVVTNYHVIKGAASLTISLSTNAQLAVENVKGVDEVGDLALLKAPGHDLPYLKFGTGSAPPIGARVYAIGSPQGLTNTLSEGLVSGIREDSGRKLIQTTAAISPGSSGGPLLNSDGEVIGVTTLYLPAGQSLNFAVAADRARKLFEGSESQQPLMQPVAADVSGWLAKARQEAWGLSDNWKGFAFTRIAEVSARAGDHDNCTTAVTAAIAVPVNTWAPWYQQGELAGILATIGELGPAKGLAESVPGDLRYAVRGYLQIAHSLAKQGDSKGCQLYLRLLKEISLSQWDRSIRDQGLLLAVVEEAETGNVTDAIRTAELLSDTDNPAANKIDWFGLVRFVEPVNPKSAALRAIVAQSAKSGQRSEALLVASRIFDRYDASRALRQVVSTDIIGGKSAEAMELLPKITEQADTVRVQVALAQDYWKRHDRAGFRQMIRAACAAADSLRDADERIDVLSEIAGLLAKAGEFQAAENIAGRLGNRWSPYFSIAIEKAAVGDYGGAKEAARRSGVEFAYGEVAAAQARAGHVMDAVATATTIRDPETRGRALGAVAESMVRNGLSDGIDAWAASLPTAEERWQVYLGAAQGLMPPEPP